MYHAIAGKKTIGTANPGNNSGNCMSSGRVAEMGMMTAAKDRMENKKLNAGSPLFFSNLCMAQNKKPASRHIAIFNPIKLPVFNIFEKSAIVEKKYIRL